MKKTNIPAIVLAAVSFVFSAAALTVGIIALVKSCSGKRLTAAEYDYFAKLDEDEEEENIGSDTLAF